MSKIVRDEFFKGKAKLEEMYSNCLTVFPDYLNSTYPILYKDDLINCYRIALSFKMEIKPNEIVKFWKKVEDILDAFCCYECLVKKGSLKNKAMLFVMQYAFAAKSFNPRETCCKLSINDQMYLRNLSQRYKANDNGMDKSRIASNDTKTVNDAPS